MAGNAHAVKKIIKENSVRNAENQSLLKTNGCARAGMKARVISAPNVESQGRKYLTSNARRAVLK